MYLKMALNTLAHENEFRSVSILFAAEAIGYVLE